MSLENNYCSTKIGYGNPNGKYWFIGPEEGGDIKGNKDRMEVWSEMGMNENFLDMKNFHLTLSKRSKFKNISNFFQGKESKLQSTWNGILKILMSLTQNENDDKTRREYQSNLLGSSMGETVIGELYPFSSKSLNDSLSLKYFGKSKKKYWEEFSPNREFLIGQKIQKHKPKLVCFYSTSFKENWYRIIASTNPKSQIQFYYELNMEYYKSNETLFVIIPHPISRKLNGKHSEIGNAIRKLLD